MSKEKKVADKPKVKEPRVEEKETPRVDEKTQEEKDLERYESLYVTLKELNISRISDLENLIATTRLKIK